MRHPPFSVLLTGLAAAAVAFWAAAQIPAVTRLALAAHAASELHRQGW